MAIIPSNVAGFPRLPVPFNNITPFTYRDGWTYLEVLEKMREHLNGIIGEINASTEDYTSDITDALNDLAESVNAALADQSDSVNAALAQQVASVNAALQEQQEQVNESLADWMDVTLETSDNITSQLILATNSLTRAAIADIMANDDSWKLAAETAVQEAVDNGAFGASVSETANSAAQRAAEWSLPDSGIWDTVDPRFSVTDVDGRIAQGVNSDGGVITHNSVAMPLSGATGFEYAITDDQGGVAFGVRRDGSVHSGQVECRVFVFAGQSNGVGYIGPVVESSDRPLNNLFAYHPQTGEFLRPTGWVPTPRWHAAAGLSPAYVMAKEYAIANPGVNVLIVNTSVGGTGFATNAPDNWRTDVDGSLYHRAVQHVHDAINNAAHLGEPIVSGFFWHQGEGDSQAMTDVEYMAEFGKVVDGVRAEFGDIPVVMGEMNPDGWTSGNQRGPRSRAQAGISIEKEKAVFVRVGRNMSASAADKTHYGREGTLTLGKNFYKGLEKAELSTDDQNPTPPVHVEAVSNGTTTTISWDLPPCRAIGYTVESSEDGSAWSTLPHTGAWRELTISERPNFVRVSTVAPSGTSAPSAAVAVIGVARDTGWRDITAQAQGVVSGRVIVKRVGAQVRLIIDELDFQPESGSILATLPLGFRNAVRVRESWYPRASGQTESLAITGDGVVYLYNTTPGNTIIANVEFETRNTMPSTLPGTPTTL